MSSDGTNSRFDVADGRPPAWAEGRPRSFFEGFRARLGRGARFLWIALGLVLVLLLISFLRQGQTTGNQGGRGGLAGGPTPVGVAKATQGDMPITLNALGTVTPLATVTVRPQVTGPILKFIFQEGQIVKAGAVLAEIDPRPFQAALDAANGALIRDRAALANAIIDLHRYQSLSAQNAIAQQQVATQAALVKQDQGAVVIDQGNVETAVLNLKYCTITSPVTGRVGIRQMDIGNLAEAGQTNGIVLVTQIEPMSVVFTLPEDSLDPVLAQLRQGAAMTASAYDRTQTNLIATGQLSAVDNQIDTTTGTVKLRATFANTDHSLFPNQFVNIRLLVTTLHSQTLVPAAAIQRGAQGTYVFVVNPDKTVSMRTVGIGPGDSTHVAILKGLKAGDTVVVDGADRLADGADVTIPKPVGAIGTPSAAPAGSAASSGAAHHGRLTAVLKQYCAADMQKYCPKAAPGSPEARACFRTNMASFSDDCRNALTKMRHTMWHGGGGFGGG